MFQPGEMGMQNPPDLGDHLRFLLKAVPGVDDKSAIGTREVGAGKRDDAVAGKLHRVVQIPLADD